MSRSSLLVVMSRSRGRPVATETAAVQVVSHSYKLNADLPVTCSMDIQLSLCWTPAIEMEDPVYRFRRGSPSTTTRLWYGSVTGDRMGFPRCGKALTLEKLLADRGQCEEALGPRRLGTTVSRKQTPNRQKCNAISLEL